VTVSHSSEDGGYSLQIEGELKSKRKRKWWAYPADELCLALRLASERHGEGVERETGSQGGVKGRGGSQN
jgi:hypothetical protein